MSQVEKALELWVELTGIDPNATRYRMNEWEIRSMNEELKESLVLDDSHVTTLMMLDAFVRDYLNERSFTVNQMLEDYESVVEYLKKSKELYSLLESTDFVEQKEEFKEWVKTALEHYKVENQQVFSMADSYENLAFLRRDALRSIQTLEVHQFYQGKTDGERPKYVTKVHEFWNINSLIRAMYSDNTFSGISLNLIRDPLASSSYFVFAIKNGQTLSILTDKPKEAHPLQKYMSRRPGKRLSERMAKNHFPYDLLDIDFDDRGDAHHSPKDSTELVLHQNKLYPLKEIKELEPDEVIWVLMMFSLIEEKFWKEDFKTKTLSYTGEMIRYQDAIPTQLNEVMLTTEYQPINLPAVTLEDISTENLKEEWEFKPTEKNSWLEKRYEHLVPNEVLNLLGNGTSVKMLTDGNQLEDLSANQHSSRTAFMSKNPLVGNQMQYVDTTTFGSREEIVSNQKWVARYNKATVIKREANREFEETKDEIQKDYFSRIKGNQKALLEAIAHGEFLAPDVQWKRQGFGDEEQYTMRNILGIQTTDERDVMSSWGAVKLCRQKEQWGNYDCFITGSKASIVAKFRPQTAEALALMCGCKIEELPEVLQHWTKADIYSGNSILDRLDPMEWVVKNPWTKINFDVEVFLSKNAYNKLRKDLGLEPNKFWLETTNS